MQIMTIARLRRCPCAAAFVLACGMAEAAPAYLNQAQQAWIAEHPRISYAPEHDYGPFIFVDATGAPQGMSADFLQLISSKSGLAFIATPAKPLSANLALAERRAVDMLTSLKPTPERAAYLSFSAPYVSIPAALVLGAGQPVRALSRMPGRRVGIARGVAAELYVRQHFPQVEWVALNSDRDALSQLHGGVLDGVVADLASVQFITRQEGWPDPAVGELIGFDYPLSFAYRSDWPVLGQILQRTLQQISPEERKAILRRWLPASIAHQEQAPRRLPLVLGCLMLALALACAWVRYRHPHVERQW
jgi:ABC-type amino acid transport substrate-binding protein